MEHWAQNCDGAGVDPAEHSKVCRERDELRAELQKVIAQLHEVKSERDELKVVLDAAKVGMAALNDKMNGVMAQRDVLAREKDMLIAFAKKNCCELCDLCKHCDTRHPCFDDEGPESCEECLREKAVCCDCAADYDRFEFVGAEVEGGGGK